MLARARLGARWRPQRDAASLLLPDLARPTDAGARIHWPDILVILAVLAALAAANREWLITIKTYEGWIYLGYFRHFDAADFLPHQKKLARLPWILVGYLVNHATSPLVAQYLLHLGLLAAAAVGLYWVAVRMFGRGVAVIIALTYATYLPAHGNGGWDYHNTLAGPLYLMTYAALLRLTQDRSRPLRRGGIAGGLLALTIHCSILFILLGPMLAFRAAVEVRAWQMGGQAIRRWALRAMAGALAGAALVTLALGLIDLSVGRKFLFFSTLIQVSTSLLANPAKELEWWRPWHDPWWHSEDQTSIPDLLVMLFLLGALAACVRAVRGTARFAVPAKHRHGLMEFMLGLLAFALVQSIGHPVLQPIYMAFPLLVPSFLALGSVIACLPWAGSWQRPAPMPWNAVATLAAAGLFLALFSGAGRHLGLVLPNPPWLWTNAPPIILTLVAFGVAATLCLWPTGRSGRRPLLTLGAVAVVVFGLAQANAQWPDQPMLRRAYHPGDACKARAAAITAIADSDEILFPLFRQGKDFELVFKFGEQLGGADCPLNMQDIGGPLSAMGYGTPMRIFKEEDFVALPDTEFTRRADASSYLAVLSNDDGFVASLLGRLRQISPAWHELGGERVGQGAYAVQLRLLSAEPAPAEWHAVAIEAGTPGDTTLTTTRIDITLAPAPASRSARLSPRGGILRGDDPITVTLRATGADAVIGVLNAAGSEVTARRVIAGDGTSRQITLRVPDWGEAGPIVVCSTQGGGEVAILRMRDARGATIPFAYAADNGARLRVWSFDVGLPTVPWHDATELKLPPDGVRSGGVAMTARATRGEVAVGLLTKDRSDFIKLWILRKGDTERDIFFTVADWASVGPIVIASTIGGSALRVSSINLLPAFGR
jgi:hypothetical protein